MANDLITLDEYKTYTGIKSVENDERIELLISSASSLIKTYCGRTFIDGYNDTITEYNNGGFSFIFLRDFPIKEVSSLATSSDYGQTYTDLVFGTDYVVDRQSDKIVIINGQSYEGYNVFKIEYTGGYEETPGDLKLAIFDLIQYYMKSENNPKKTIGFVSVEYITSSDFPHHIKRVLDLYRVL